LPLRISEILRVLAAWHFSWSRFIGWIAQTPGSAPLSYFAQLPFLLISPHGRLAARFPSLLFAIGASILLFQLFRKVVIKRAYLALAAFMLLPVHFRAATDARGFEQALFVTVVQLLCFLRLVRTPAIKSAVLYGIALTVCLYTDPYSFLPAIGQFLFLLRFISRAHERRAVWFALPATAAPPLLFLPYYLWARPQASSIWISVPDEQLRGWSVYVLAILLIAGFLIAVWTTFWGMNRNPSKRIFLFCAAGGVVSSVVMGRVLWAAPGLILLFFAAFDWLSTNRGKRLTAYSLAGLFFLCCIVSEAGYLHSRPDDLQRQAAAISQRLTGDSCIVFLTHGLSKDLFVLFQPQLDQHECHTFFHRRVIVAIHPYVGLKERTDVASYFRALNFHEKERFQIGRGEIMVLEQGK
jgi:hypothetical protein